MPPGVNVTQILKSAVPTAKTASNAPVFLPSSTTASVANASDFAERGEDFLRLLHSTPFIYAESTCDRRRASALGKRTRTQRTIQQRVRAWMDLHEDSKIYRACKERRNLLY